MPYPTPAPSVAGDNHAANNRDINGDELIQAPENHGEYPLFGNLCTLLDRLQRERKQDNRRAILSKWFELWRERVGPDLYPLLRLLLPQKDRERAVYGLKEKKLAKHFIDAYSVDRKSRDAVHLLNWKKPAEKSRTVGDFPSVLFEFVSKRSSVTRGTITLDQVNAYLDLFATVNSSDSKEVTSAIRKISEEATPSEQRWLVRIILKDLIISVKETTILSVFHPDALTLFNTCSDLKRVAHTLFNPEYRLDDADKHVKLFRCFAPMLCKRPTHSLAESVKLMDGAAFLIEEKLDGERMQIHKRGHQYAYYSRKGKDYTYLYGADVGAPGGSLTKWLDRQIAEGVNECILDGEMLVYDPISQQLLPFGNLKTAAIEGFKSNKGARPCFKVFDILYLNGQSFLEKKLSARKELIRRIIRPLTGRVELPFETEGTNIKDITTALQKVVEERGEGLVIKHPASTYRLNGRVNDWIKVKPEYMDNLGETVDVLVVAGNYGSGKRAGGVSTLICAVREDRDGKDDDDDENQTFVTFVRIGTGYSFQDLAEIRKRPWKERDPKNPPKWLITSPMAGPEDKGDVYIEPADSFIVTVKAAEITKSDQYGLNQTMRFPRCTRIRDDLNYTDCQTASSILEMINTQVRKRDDEIATDAPRKKRKTAKKPTALSQSFKGADTTSIEVTATFLEGMKFHVYDNNRKVDEKKTLETLIKQHGGTFCQKPKPSELETVFRVYNGREPAPLAVKNVVKEDVSDILLSSWIFDCVAQGKRIPLSKKYFFHRASEKTHTQDEDEEYEAGSDNGQDDNDADEDMELDLDARRKMPPPADLTSGAATASPSATAEQEDDAALEAQLEEEAANSQYSEWMVVSEKDKMAQSTHRDEPGDESETEDEDEGDGDWEVLSSGETLSSSSTSGVHAVRMGEDDTAMEYDPDLIFKHLCFYLDSPANARRNGMDADDEDKDQLAASFNEISKIITENGGKIADLSEPKLTHVVVDPRDRSRVKEIIARTALPKMRQMVTVEFVRQAVEQQSLLDEDGFRP